MSTLDRAPSRPGLSLVAERRPPAVDGAAPPSVVRGLVTLTALGALVMALLFQLYR